jgi:hypothetical protein
LPHDDDDLRLDDVELARQPAAGVLLRDVFELQVVGPVDRHRVHVEALDRLEDRLAGAAEERDALVHLRRLRAVLQEKDVAQRVARP